MPFSGPGALAHPLVAPLRCHSCSPTSISRFDQFNEVKEVCPGIDRFGSSAVRGAISRVDEAGRFENWARHCVIEIVVRYGVICLEDLNLVTMTKPAEGTKETPGKGVAQKKGLKRSFVDAALSRLAYLDLRQGGGGRTQSMKGQPEGFFERVRRLWAHRGGQPEPEQIHLPQVRVSTHADVNAAQVITARDQVAETSWRASGCPGGPEARGEEPAAQGGRAIKQYGAGSAPYAAVTRTREVTCDRP